MSPQLIAAGAGLLVAVLALASRKRREESAPSPPVIRVRFPVAPVARQLTQLEQIAAGEQAMAAALAADKMATTELARFDIEPNYPIVFALYQQALPLREALAPHMAIPIVASVIRPFAQKRADGYASKAAQLFHGTYLVSEDPARWSCVLRPSKCYEVRVWDTDPTAKTTAPIYQAMAENWAAVASS